MNICKVFYSWQSDLPNKTNRGFIQNALESAAKSIRDDDSIKVEPVIDRDTAGVPGSPDIANTIFSKIEESDVFACDVSIINDKENTRPSPNPNVLIELGYALKALKSERILMIMNTAFGKPEFLPFDLSKKRVITYELVEGSTQKANVRKELNQKMAGALRMIVSKIGDVTVKGKLSGDKKKLKDECEAVLASGNSNELRKIVDELWSKIPTQMIDWKARAEKVWNKGDTERETARFEAVEICLPIFIPILVAVEGGNKDLWEQAVGPLRQLAILRNNLMGGFTDVVNIGSHMLYIAGNLGMAIAARTKQLDVVNNWMKLPMPVTEYEEVGEKPWSQIYFAHRLWGHYMPGNSEPFRDILKISESDYLFGFFPKRDELVKYLFLANLGQSLFELGRCVEKGECLKYLENVDRKRIELDLDVWPVWALMKPDEFRSGTLELFGSSKGVLEFVFPRGESTEKFWGWWKKWKEICVHNLMRGELQKRAPRMLHAGSLLLPGEPHGQVNK